MPARILESMATLSHTACYDREVCCVDNEASSVVVVVVVEVPTTDSRRQRGQDSAPRRL